VLAPDGLKGPAMVDSQFQTIQIPGGSQALRGVETVELVLDGVGTPVRRPTLLAAILLKARSLMVHRETEAQREDLIALLALMSDPRAAEEDLKASERRWLRDAAADRLSTIGPGEINIPAAARWADLSVAFT
jgi:hypothetical protein